MIENEIFKKSDFIRNELIKYGFKKENKIYTYETAIMNNSFKIVLCIKNNILKGKVIDVELGEEYLGYRVENQIGEFASTIKNEFINILLDIKNKCCINKYFLSDQANRISNCILEKYGDNPEFLWEEDKSGVFRNANNKKWYAIIMYININKISSVDKNTEVMNIKLSPDKIEELLKKKGFYKAYHMNKKYWITITLDNSVSDDEIMELVEESYSYTIDTNEWVIPANPKYFDVISYLDNSDIVNWKQSSNINVGDIVYLYVGAPYSAILYKLKAIEVNIPYEYKDKNLSIRNEMKLKVLKKYSKDTYSFDIIKKYDLRAIRGPRKMSKKLLDYMSKNDIL